VLFLAFVAFTTYLLADCLSEAQSNCAKRSEACMKNAKTKDDVANCQLNYADCMKAARLAGC